MDEDRILLSQSALAIGTAFGTLAFGAVIVAGAIEYDIGWGERGPQPGYFPFWLGLLIMAGSLGTLLEAIAARSAQQTPALTLDQARRVATFLVPIAAFLVVTNLLGLYVAMILYLSAVMVTQGGYRLPAAAAVSLGTAVFFFFVFDRWLKVPLMKGPLEAWLGIY
jgi:Tripartite tricarboxylate transporter TctB family